MKSHTGVTNQFHHKYAIADANVLGSNPAILTGSHNWSSNAENNSDENIIIIHDHTIANIYLQEFEKRWGELGGSNSLEELINIELSVFPNPSPGKVEVKSDLLIQQINLYTLDGKLINVTQESDLQFEDPGIYFVKIITEKGIVVKKIVIE